MCGSFKFGRNFPINWSFQCLSKNHFVITSTIVHEIWVNALYRDWWLDINSGLQKFLEEYKPEFSKMQSMI